MNLAVCLLFSRGMKEGSRPRPYSLSYLLYTYIRVLLLSLCLRVDSRALQPPGGGGEGVIWRRVFRDRQRPPHSGGHQEDRSDGGAQVRSMYHVLLLYINSTKHTMNKCY